MPYPSTTIAWRGKLADAVTKVHQHHDPRQDVTGRIACPHCGSPLPFTIQKDGHSRGSCVAGCGIRWCH